MGDESKDWKRRQLGMDHGVAARRLKTDLLFEFVVGAGYVCHKCGKPLIRDLFSVEHKTEWLGSRDPFGLFFDTSNIVYGHSKCPTSE